MGQEDAVGAGVRRLKSRVGQGRSRGSGRLGSRGEVEGRERGIGIVGVTGVSIGRILFRRVKKMLRELGGGWGIGVGVTIGVSICQLLVCWS